MFLSYQIHESVTCIWRRLILMYLSTFKSILWGNWVWQYPLSFTSLEHPQCITSQFYCTIINLFFPSNILKHCLHESFINFSWLELFLLVGGQRGGVSPLGASSLNFHPDSDSTADDIATELGLSAHLLHYHIHAITQRRAKHHLI